MVVVAVEDLDVDAGLGHATGEEAELAGQVLLQADGDDVALGDDTDALRFERAAGAGAILEQEVGDAAAVDDPGAAPLDADAGAPQAFAHLGEGGRAVLEGDRQVFHLAVSRSILRRRRRACNRRAEWKVTERAVNPAPGHAAPWRGRGGALGPSRAPPSSGSPLSRPPPAARWRRGR